MHNSDILNGFKASLNNTDELKYQYKGILESLKIKDYSQINETIDKSLMNIKEWKKRFVIYWEPQSGKTNMMIALTAKLVDEWYSKIIILVNDNVQLLQQNITRFQRSKLKPLPQDIDSCTWDDFSKKSKFILFTKKNSSNLKNVFDLTKKVKDVLIIDDEADYASPNSKVNSEDEKTKINELIWNILWESWMYIWVTATPARLDLNLTFENSIEDWVQFKPYLWYKWDKTFFPNSWKSTKDNPILEYTLNLFKDDFNHKNELRKAFFNFIINVSYLNKNINEEELNYCMLVHTSFKTDHQYEDYDIINWVIAILQDKDNSKFDAYFNEIIDLIGEKFEWIQSWDINAILHYIKSEVEWGLVKVINSKESNKSDYIDKLTNPVSPFTVVIWWNILSRWLTFNNLLSMFFVRSTKSWKLQQDTYIQMARMFWNRNKYIKFFELNIPESLFSAWWEQFDLHRLSFSFLKNWIKPKWFYSNSSTPASNNSIDKQNTETEFSHVDDTWFVSINAVNREVYSNKFDYTQIKNIVNQTKIESHNNAIDLLLKIKESVPVIEWFMNAILENINIEDWISFHPILSIEWQKSVPAELQMEVRTKWEWLLPNIWKENPNIRIHCRIYHYQEKFARLYVYFRERENLIVWWRNMKSVSRK